MVQRRMNVTNFGITIEGYIPNVLLRYLVSLDIFKRKLIYFLKIIVFKYGLVYFYTFLFSLHILCVC